MVRIDVTDPTDVQAWSKRFHCSPAELVEAVNDMGPVAEDVHLFLSHRLPQVPDSIDPAVFRTQASLESLDMNVYTYEFRTIPGEGANAGRWELLLLHNSKVVEVHTYASGDSKDVDEAVLRGQEWVARMERGTPPG
jgi:Protein of unknown function (DUF3606)